MLAFRSLVWLALTAAMARAEPATQPLGLRTQGSFRELFLDMPLTDARPSARAELEVALATANDWSIPTEVKRDGRVVAMRNDEEADSLTLRARLPWTRLGLSAARLVTTLEWRLTEHWGGFSDRMVEGLHAAIRVNDYQRTSYPRDQVRLYLREPGGASPVALDGAQTAAGDLVARTQLAVAGNAGDAWALALRFDVKAPLGDLAAAGGSGGWDAGIGVAATVVPASWLALHAMLTVSAWSGLPGDFPLQPRRWHASADASLAFRLGATTLLVEDRVVSPLFESGWSVVTDSPHVSWAVNAFAVFLPHNQVAIGLRRGGLALWFAEDVTPGRAYELPGSLFYTANAPDFAAGMTYTRPL